MMAADDGNPSGDHANTCVICLERLNDGVIGAATPCGHCFHESCFEGWRHSQNRTTPHSPWFEQLQPVKCPMCNKEAAGFFRIYLDLDALGSGGGPGDDDDDDDDDSESDDSSLGSDGNDDHENDGDHDVVGEGDPPSGSEADLEMDRSQDERGRGLETDQMSSIRKNSTAARFSGSVEVIEIDDDDDDDDEARDDAAIKGTSTKGTCGKKKKNYRAKAKLLKRRMKILESRRSEQYQELVVIQDKFGKARSKVSELEAEMKGLRAKSELHERERESTTLQLVRLSREKDELSASLEQAAADREKAERRLDEARKDHERELKRSQASSMSEVQKMLNDHPHLIRENRELKQLNEKYKVRLRELQSQNGPAVSNVRNVVHTVNARTVASSNPDGPAGGRRAPVPSSAVDAARQLSALDARHRADQTRRERDERNAQSRTDMLGKVSAHAARFTSRPAGEKRKPFPLASLSLLDAKNVRTTEGERSDSNPKRPPSQLLPITMPIQKRSKPGSLHSRGSSFLSNRR